MNFEIIIVPKVFQNKKQSSNEIPPSPPKKKQFALLATVVKAKNDDMATVYKVAFVDIALEKVLTAPTHKRRKRTQVRRDVTLNLAKTK